MESSNSKVISPAFAKATAGRHKSKLQTARRRLVWLGVIVIVVLAGVFSGGQDAKADPHAVFYTAIGQQQLFFNVLAALDQADYVEPKEGTFGREELITERGTVTAIPKFTPEENKLITATETELSSVITRGITLEGNDLYTDFLVRAVAIQNAKNDATSRLAFAQCEGVYGKYNCGVPEDLGNEEEEPGGQVGGITSNALAAIAPEPEPGTPEFYERQKKAADKVRVRDPLEYGSRYFWNGALPALFSGYIGSGSDSELSDANIRIKTAEAETDVSLENEPIAYSVDVGAWRQHNRDLRTGTDLKGHKSLINVLAVKTLQEMLNGNFWGGVDDKGDPDFLVDNFPFENVVFNDDGTVTVIPEATLTDSLNRFTTSLRAPGNLNKIARAAAGRIELQQTYGEASGVKPSTKLKDWAGLGLYGPVNLAANTGELSQLYNEPVARPQGAAQEVHNSSYSPSRTGSFVDPRNLVQSGEAPLPTDGSTCTSSSCAQAALIGDSQAGQVAV